MGSQLCLRTGHTGLGRTGSPAQVVVGVTFKAHGEAALSKNRAHRTWGDGESSPQGVGVTFRAHGEAALSKNRARWPGGDGESSPGGERSILLGPWRGASPKSRAHRPEGTGSPAQGVVRVSFWAHGEAQRPGEDGESSHGGARSIPLGPWGGDIV